MSKRLILGVLLTVVAFSALLAVWLLRGGDGSTRAQGEAVEMGIDPEVTGNTAGTLGTLEDCVRIDVASPEFDNVSDYDIDVYVRGDTQAPTAYDAYVTYDATKVRVAVPGTNALIKLPGASAFSDALPDTDGKFVAGAVYLGGGPGAAGDGTLVRLGLDIGGSGVVTFDFDPAPPTTAYASASGDHPITRRTGQLAINEECPEGERAGGGGGPEGEAQLVRWGNVTIELPADSDINYARLSSAPQAMARGIMGPVLYLFTRGDSDGSELMVDATTGKVVYEGVLPEERAAFDAVRTTVEVAAKDVAAEPDAPWPYGSKLPDTPRPRFANLSWAEPDPASGISVQFGTADFIEPQPPGSGSFIRIFNGRSQMHINGAGRVLVTEGADFALAEFTSAEIAALDGIHPDDREAFQRFAQAVEVGPPPKEEEP